MKLFDGKIDTQIDFSLSDDGTEGIVLSNLGKVSISGAQEKFSAITENGKIRLTKDGERGTHILKPAPLNHAILNRKQMPANEFLTMQIAYLGSANLFPQCMSTIDICRYEPVIEAKNGSDIGFLSKNFENETKKSP